METADRRRLPQYPRRGTACGVIAAGLGKDVGAVAGQNRSLVGGDQAIDEMPEEDPVV